MQLEEKAFYWALTSYDELTVVQFENDELWQIGDDVGVSVDRVKIIAKIEAPERAGQ